MRISVRTQSTESLPRFDPFAEVPIPATDVEIEEEEELRTFRMEVRRTVYVDQYAYVYVDATDEADAQARWDDMSYSDQVDAAEDNWREPEFSGFYDTGDMDDSYDEFVED